MIFKIFIAYSITNFKEKKTFQNFFFFFTFDSLFYLKDDTHQNLLQHMQCIIPLIDTLIQSFINLSLVQT